MIIQKDGNPCKCGNLGCFETYASIKVLKKKITNYLELNPDISGKELRELIEKNMQNEGVVHIIDEYIEYLSIGLVNLINIFEPQAIGIGGSFSHYEDILLKKLEERLNKKDLVFNKDEKIIIKLALLENDAGIIGAAML